MPYSAFEFGIMSLSMVMPALILYYLKKLEAIGCKCAMNYKRTYIMHYTIFNLGFGAASLVSGGRLIDYIEKSSFAIPIILVLAVAGITNIVFTLMYVEELKKDNCECSESVFRTMMYILSIIGAVVWGLVIVLLLMLGYMVGSLREIQVPTLKSSKGKK